MPSIDTARFEALLDRFRVDAGEPFALADHDPTWEGNEEIPKKDRKDLAEEILADGIEALRDAQELLWASDRWSVLVVLQAMDAAGKDSTIKHVLSGVNPQGCRVVSFKKPSAEELDHDFLWRCAVALPRRGEIGIFNRSHYEEVLVVRVHPGFLAGQQLPGVDGGEDPGPAFWAERYESINDFERHLVRNGTQVLKFFLNVSWEEQRERFLERLERPEKHWKFNAADVAERQRWDDYQHAYEAAIRATSTAWAPWYVVPADHKWVTRAVVAQVMVRRIRELGLAFPTVPEGEMAALDESRRELLAEKERL
jgi:PPK2 family polyphosphate:nucleotide phosphotransferase